jgi:REase_DpnII-MboI/Uncharacterized protein conserved in bacteria (DUF2321)
MNQATEDPVQDVMQVCWNGHVVTDLLRAYPERGLTHCDRCGAQTLHCCLTCGGELPGAFQVPGLVPVGVRRPPRYCPTCGAAFPWVKDTPRPLVGALAGLDTLLRRLPRVVRQLRNRQGDRPAFRVEDERDLEDLLRALLPLHSDDVRPQARTPSYAAGTRTDFLLAPQRCVVLAKLVRPAVRDPQLMDQFREDAEFYRRREDCRALIGLAYDPEGLLREPKVLEAACSLKDETPSVRCVVAGF